MLLKSDGKRIHSTVETAVALHLTSLCGVSEQHDSISPPVIQNVLPAESRIWRSPVSK